MSMPYKRDGVDSVTSGFPAKVVTLYGGEAITSGDVVALSLTGTTTGLGGTVEQADSDDLHEATVVGVALQTITAAGFIKVQTAGKATGINCASSVAAGDLLVVSSTAGRSQEVEAYVGTAVAAADFRCRPFAAALTAASSNTCTAMIMDAGWF